MIPAFGAERLNRKGDQDLNPYRSRLRLEFGVDWKREMLGMDWVFLVRRGRKISCFSSGGHVSCRRRRRPSSSVVSVPEVRFDPHSGRSE